MQSRETVQSLASVDRELIERRLRLLVEYRKDLDLSAMFACMAPQVTYELVGNPADFPFAGRKLDLAGLRDMMLAMNMAYEHLDAEVLDVVIEGDCAAVIRTVCVRHRVSGTIRRTHLLDRVRFSDGLIVEILEFADTMLLAEFYGSPRYG